MKNPIRKLFIPKNTPYCHHSFKQHKKYVFIKGDNNVKD